MKCREDAQVFHYFYNNYYNFPQNFQGLGNYTLLAQHKGAALSVEDISLISCYSPDKVVQNICDGDHSTTTEHNTECFSEGVLNKQRYT